MVVRTAVLLLFCYLFSATELSQFLKLPMLIGHYLEHKEQQKDLSVWAFLCNHYANGDVHDADYDKDMKLPFKTCSNHGYNEKPFQVVSTENLIPQDLGIEFLHPQLDCYGFIETSVLRGSIWQPPKFC